MKIRLFNFIKRNPKSNPSRNINPSRDINCNPPLKNIANIPNNLPKELTTSEQVAKIIELIKKILADMLEKDKEILAQLKRISENKSKSY